MWDGVYRGGKRLGRAEGKGEGNQTDAEVSRGYGLSTRKGVSEADRDKLGWEGKQGDGLSSSAAFSARGTVQGQKTGIASGRAMDHGSSSGCRGDKSEARQLENGVVGVNRSRRCLMLVKHLRSEVCEGPVD